MLHNNNGSSSEDDEEDDFKQNTFAAYSIVHRYQPKRVILLLDIDCFEVQLWMQKLKPDLIGKDVPVIVKNPDGIILSVNYTAKLLGVKRGEGRKGLVDARSLCNRAGIELQEITTGIRYGKVDSFLPLTESNQVLDSVFRWSNIKGRARYFSTPITIERTCRDELYIDVTDLIDEKIKYYQNKSRGANSVCIPNQLQIEKLIRLKDHPNEEYNGKSTTRMEGRHRKITGEEFSYRIRKVYPSSVEAYHQDELRLVHGAIIANSIIQHIERETKYEVSAGVGHSKLIAKLACGLNKPKGICIITDVALPRLNKSIPFQDLPGFGGKIGDAVQNLISLKWGKNVTCINDTLRATNDGIDLDDVLRELNFPNHESTALDLYNSCHFRDESLVTSKVHPDTINTVLSFKGCHDKDVFDRGLWNITRDMKSRINYYKRHMGRRAQQLVIKADHISISDDPHVLPSRPQDTCNVVSLPIGRNKLVNPKHMLQSVGRYMRENGICWDTVTKIYLTAKNIIEDDEADE